MTSMRITVWCGGRTQFGSARLMTAISTSAHRSSPPNSTKDGRSPFTSRCAKAHSAKPVSCGCRIWVPMRFFIPAEANRKKPTSTSRLLIPFSAGPAAHHIVTSARW